MQNCIESNEGNDYIDEEDLYEYKDIIKASGKKKQRKNKKKDHIRIKEEETNTLPQ